MAARKKKYCCEQLRACVESGYFQTPLLQFDRISGKLTQKTPQLYVEAVIANALRAPRSPKTVNLFLGYCPCCGAKL